jgi:ubiquitin carboxyl-terminal hydrolase 8
MIPKGIQNLGNTCFINACMQILLQTPELDYSIIETEMQKNIPETKIYNEWKSCKESVENPAISIISPISFIEAIHQIAQLKNQVLFSGFAQNDMPEFLLFFIDNLHNHLKCEIQYNIFGIQQNDTDKLAIQCYEMMKTKYEKDYSPLIDIFFGISVSNISSLDKYPLSSISEPYFVLDLPIYGNNIYDCLDNYVSHELLDNENAWYNEKTQQKENVFKQISFWNFPKIVVFTFKRFSSTITREGIHLLKKMDFIDFPLDELDLSKYICGYNASKYKYELYGICNHMGNVMGGHYTAFVKTKEKQWFHCNDTIIEKIENPQQIVTSMAYALFYRRLG